MYGYIDDDGSYVVTDTRQDPRARPYTPGDFERLALSQTGTPHEGLGSVSRGRLESPYDALIERAAARHGVPYSLVKAVVAAESGFDPRALSRAGAQGLMQLMPGTARDLGVDDPLDPAKNVEGGTRYLGALLRSFKSERLALAAYNAGPTRVAKLGRVPDFPETQAYIGKVLSLRALYDDPQRSR
jgi:soluble lytic murein transglycosylase-like protein